MKTDYETVAVPAVYKAVTGYDYEDLNDATQTQQSMESLVGFMKEDTNERIQSIQANLSKAQSTSDPEVRQEALLAAQSDTRVVEQEITALGATAEAVGTASGSDTSALPAPLTARRATQRTPALSSTIFSAETATLTLYAICSL